MKHRIHRNAALLTVMLVAAVIAAGCSKAEQLVREAEQGTATFTKADGEQIKLSSESDIPELFPDDLPMPVGIRVTSSISSDDNATMTIETEKPYDEVIALYVDYAEQAGYSEVHRLEDATSLHYSAQKGTERFVVTLQLDLEDNKTVSGALVYSKEPETGQ